MSTSQFDKALQLINEPMNRPGKIEGKSYKMQIIPRKYQNAEISNLIDQIKSILGVELHFVDLSVFKKTMKPIKYWNGTKIGNSNTLNGRR
jgi:hypothetical protein